MKTLLALLLLATISTQAAVVSYRQTIRITRTGDGATTKRSIGGWYLIDGDTGEQSQIVTSKTVTGKTVFKVIHPSDDQDSPEFIRSYQLSSGVLRSATLICQTFPSVDTSGKHNSNVVTFKGANVAGVKIGTTNTWTIPKSLTVTGRGVTHDNPTQETVLEEYLGAMSLDSKLATILNTAGMTLAGAESYVRNMLIASGAEEN